MKKDTGFRNPTSHFLNYIAEMSKRNITISPGAGRVKNYFFYSGNGRSGNFKKNQRKERALSRRRKMKPSARHGG